MLSIEDLRNIKGFGKKMEERVKEYIEKKERKNKYDDKIQKITPPEKHRINLDNIYQGESVEFMRKNIPDNSIDMVLTSPPYDNLRDYNGFEFDYEIMLREIYRVLKDGGVCVWVVGDSVIDRRKQLSPFKQAIYANMIGLKLYDNIIYHKTTPSPPHKDRYFNTYEYMFVFFKGDKPKCIKLLADRKNKTAGRFTGSITRREQCGKLTRKNGVHIGNYGIRDNIWSYDVGNNKTTKDKFAYQHPAIFPEKLAEDHILSWSNEGDIVLDPMCGSGTTCKMAKLNNRRFIGIDISKEYVDLSEKRCEIK